MKATNDGTLKPVSKCTISIPYAGTITLNNLPDISDSKSAVYNNEAIIGRSTPLYTYSHSGDRNIGLGMHFFVVTKDDVQQNMKYLRWIQSALYPRGSDGNSPFVPPVICQLKCGDLLATDVVCCFLQSYSVKFPPDVAWDEETYCPYKFDVETSWTVVYDSSDLPNQKRIVDSGR